MGNYRFRFSDMIPNAWFYKLRDMPKHNNNHNRNTKKIGTTKLLHDHPSQITKIPLPAERKSYYFTREVTFHQNSPIKKSDFLLPAEPPRNSSRMRGRRRIRQSQPTCSCRATLESAVDYPTVTPSGDGDDVAGFDLPPIITKKPNRTFSGALSVKENFSSSSRTPGRRGISANSPSSPGVRLRTNAARIASRGIGQGRKSVSLSLSSRRTESVAVRKKSEDPGKDFRESMVVMIAENNIRAGKDLEELLACYLSLNSDEYHDLIVDVFKQIWFDTHKN